MSVTPSRKKVSQERNLGGKRCVRFSVSINNEYDKKLNRLSISCGKSKSEMSDQLLRIALDSIEVIDWVQKRFNTVEEYRVRPVIINGKTHY